MSLKFRVTVLLVGVFSLTGAVSLAIQHHVILPRFLELEEASARADLQRALAALQRELDQLEPSVADWAYWTDTWRFARGEAPDYRAENLAGGSALTDLRVHYLGIYRPDGTALWRAARDLRSGRPLLLGELTVDRLSSHHRLLAFRDRLDTVRGLIRTLQGPMLVVSKPILTNDRRGPPAGAVIMGRLVNAELAEQLARQLHRPLALRPVRDGPTPAWRGDPRHGLASGPPRLHATARHWQAELPLADIHGHPVLTVAVQSPRDITALGTAAVHRSLWSLAGTAVVAMVLLWWLLQRSVLGPLARLERHARRVGTGHSDTRLDLARNDEIGLLARTLDDMVARLAEAQRRLVEQSFRAGVAEMASGVLHNIGNAVTPLLVRLEGLRERLGQAPAAEVARAVAELDDPATAPARRADLECFLRLAGGQLARLVEESRAEVERAGEQLRHVQDILADQARFSRAERVVEPVDMARLLDEARRDLPAALRKALHIEVEPGLAQAPPVAGSTVALRQVLGNLLWNAAEAVQAGPRGRGTLRVAGRVEDGADGPCLHLRLCDDGAGIEPDHLPRLFERGFSTKGRGSGQGLHWSANTVRALGGRLQADSAGPGRGACFHLYLPLHAAPAAATGTDG